MERRTFVRSTFAAAAAVCLPRNDALAALYRPATPQGQEVPAVTGDGKRITLKAQAIADLRARLRGRLLLAGNEGYDQARMILNPSFDKRPALIAQVTGAADIQTAVNFARENEGLLLAVKCGGHSFSGQSTCDGGLLIDLSPFRAVRVDPVAKRAWVTGGSLLGLVDHEAMAHGLVVPLGTVSHTGVGGLVTGGGFGRVARRFGLSIDNLLAVDVITADGQLRRASASENADLFWGVRGGGGNFGVVTNFEFQLHPMQRQVAAGRIMYPIARAKDALSLYASYAPEAPVELQLDCALVQPQGGAPGMVGFSVCYSGAPGGLDKALAPVRGLGTPLADNVTAMDYVAVQRSGDVTDPRALGMYIKSGFVTEVPADLISAILSGFQGSPQRMTQVVLVQSGGVIARVPMAGTAFSHRDALANMLVMVAWPNGSDPAPHITWIKQYYQPLERFTTGFYVNDTPMDATTAAIQSNYRENHARLVTVKDKYDPKNLFRLNANVRPTA
jgi:FAD/FMN-containing dehydrogenase